MDEFSGRLSKHELAAINDPDHAIYVSVISLWEVAIKQAAGKLNIEPFEKKLYDQNFHIISIDVGDLEEFRALPLHHRDPFDRILVAQAKRNKLTMITHDIEIMKYDVKLLK